MPSHKLTLDSVYDPTPRDLWRAFYTLYRATWKQTREGEGNSLHMALLVALPMSALFQRFIHCVDAPHTSYLEYSYANPESAYMRGLLKPKLGPFTEHIYF